MKKLFASLLIAVAGVAMLTTTNAAEGCGHGWHRNYHGYCVRNHRVMYVPPPPPPVRVQTITQPARTGIIPSPGNNVCPYGFHNMPNGQCHPN